MPYYGSTFPALACTVLTPLALTFARVLPAIPVKVTISSLPLELGEADAPAIDISAASVTDVVALRTGLLNTNTIGWPEPIPRVLVETRTSPKSGGVLFASIPRGDDSEGWNNSRFSAYDSPQGWQRHCGEAGLVEVTR